MSQIAHQNENTTNKFSDSTNEIRVTTKFGSELISNVDMNLRAAGGGSGSALRVTPLLLLTGSEGQRSLVVGHVFTAVGATGISIEATIVAAWSENGDLNEFTLIAADEADNRRLAEDRCISCLQTQAMLPAPLTDPALVAATLAKGLAESARNTMRHVREVRYALETYLAESSKDAKASEEYTDVIAALLQLNVICGRAADQAREAVREGLWVHATDPEAYHSYRKLQDLSLINEYAPATNKTRPWMRLHDAAIRQCQEMCSQAEKESESIRMLLSAASSISSAREADAQARFNLLIALLSIGLGIPALFLTLYGANLLLPMNTWPKVGAFVPVGVALLAAGAAAIWYAPRGSKRRVWLFCGTAVLLVLVLMIVSAILAPVSLP